MEITHLPQHTEKSSLAQTEEKIDGLAHDRDLMDGSLTAMGEAGVGVMDFMGIGNRDMCSVDIAIRVETGI